MLRELYCIGLLSLVTASLGCAVCCSPDDCNYAAYGGRWQRHDMSSGRVGSAFAEAGFDALGDVVEGEAVVEPEAETAPDTQAGDDHIRPASYGEASPDEVSSYIE